MELAASFSQGESAWLLLIIVFHNLLSIGMRVADRIEAVYLGRGFEVVEFVGGPIDHHHDESP